MERVILFAVASVILWVSHLVYKFLKKRKHHLRLLKVRDTIDNIYIVSLHPISDETPGIGEMANHAVFSPASEVESTEREWKALLTESGNRFWIGEVKESARLNVVSFYYRDGENICESFEEYGERVKFAIMADMAQRHGVLKQLDEDWYKWVHHKQNVIEWDVKNKSQA